MGSRGKVCQRFVIAAELGISHGGVAIEAHNHSLSIAWHFWFCLTARPNVHRVEFKDQIGSI